MGCPPDPVEVSIGRDNEARANAEAKFEELGKQKEELLKIFEELKPFIPQNSDFSESVRLITNAIPEKEVVLKEAGYGEYADAHEASNKKEYAFEKLKNREESICIIRHEMLKLYSGISILPKELKKSLIKELGLHKEHREDDRRTWLSWLNEKIQTVEFLITQSEEEKKKSQLAYLKGNLQNLKDEKVRVQKLTPKELLEQRDIFGRNPKDFELDYSRIEI